MTETSDRISEGWFMILLQDTCRDPGGGQIVTTTAVMLVLTLLSFYVGLISMSS